MTPRLLAQLSLKADVLRELGVASAAVARLRLPKVPRRSGMRLRSAPGTIARQASLDAAGGHSSRLRLCFFQLREALPLLPCLVCLSHFFQCPRQLIMRARVAGLQCDGAAQRQECCFGIAVQERRFARIVKDVFVLRIE